MTPKFHLLGQRELLQNDVLWFLRPFKMPLNPGFKANVAQRLSMKEYEKDAMYPAGFLAGFPLASSHLLQDIDSQPLPTAVLLHCRPVRGPCRVRGDARQAPEAVPRCLNCLCFVALVVSFTLPRWEL